MNVNEAFPYHDKSGNPQFRAGQLDAINFVKQSIDDNFKYIAIDGKTGCGKSVINYTVLRSLPGRSVYLTPQKQLQDQIGAEGWEDVSVLKGYSGYACTHCQKPKEIKYRTNYDGPDVEICNNTTDKRYNIDFPAVRIDIARHIKALNGTKIKQYKTNFDTISDYDTALVDIEQYFEDQYEEQMKLDEGKRIAIYKNINPDTIDLDKFIKRQVYTSIACPLGHHECPKKSARMMTTISKISVLNPDIMYYMNKFSQNSPFRKIDTLVIDEAHGFEDVIQRIFSTKMPISIIKDVYGIDFYPLVDDISPPKAVEEFNNNYREKLGAILNSLKVVNKFHGIYGISTKESSNKMGNRDIWYVPKFTSAYSKEIRMGEAQPLIEVVKAINGKYTPFSETIESAMDDDLEYADLSKIIASCKRHLSGKMLELRKSKAKSNGLGTRDISDNLILFGMLRELKAMIEPFIDKTESLASISGDESLSFLFNTTDGVVDDIPYNFRVDDVYDRSEPIVNLETVILNVGAVARMFFYSCAKNVVFTTGTWIYKDSMMNSLGINSDNTAFHEIPSTFPVNKRPIYLIRDKALTNFSAKNSDGVYYYDTPGGKAKYVDSTIKMIESIQDGIRDTQGGNPNILVHTNSFKISKTLAENGLIDPTKYVFHSPANTQFYNNKYRGNILTYSKEQFMIHCEENPNSGLVLISPSISEGVDFKHDLARAQIILKHPMPNWGDVYIRALMGQFSIDGIAVDRDIYNRKIYTTLVQQYGRVMRDDTDWGLTFIIDQKSIQDIGKLMMNNRVRRKANVEYFLDGIKMKELPNGGIKLLRPTKFMLDY